MAASDHLQPYQMPGIWRHEGQQRLFPVGPNNPDPWDELRSR